MNKLIEEEKESLKRFYSSLKDNFRREKGTSKNDSLLISLLNTRGPKRFAILRRSVIPSTSVKSSIALSLISKNLIQVYGSIDQYVITAKGVWQFELDQGIIKEETVMEYINLKFFNDEHASASIKNNLKDEEKVILLAMIAARSFSDESPVDLKKEEEMREKWREVLEKAYDLLNDMHLLGKSKNEIFKKSPNEHITNYMFRHNSYCFQKTREIYKYKGNFVYYLSLMHNNAFSKDELSFLFWKIFEGKIVNSIDGIVNFLNRISEESIYLFDMKKHLFASPYYDSIVKNCLLDSFMAQDKWSKIS